MPRINPLLLLKTLSVLLGPDGGIKESEDVQRVVNLMVRFSKKLVSKCIYIQILLATKEHLLDDFYSHGGWDLVTGWFSDTCDRENWRLLEDMLHLFKKSPVTVERLKMNHCPKQVKHLSKEAQCEVVKELAQEVVDMWMKVIKGEPGAKDRKRRSTDSEEGEETENKWKMEIRNGRCVIKKVDVDAGSTAAKKEAASPRATTEEETTDAKSEGGSGGDSGGEAQKNNTEKDGTGDPEVAGEGAKDEGDEQSERKPEGDEVSAVDEPASEKKDVEVKSKKEENKKDESKSPRGKKREHSSSRSDSKSKRKSSDKSSDKGSDSKDKSKKSSSSRHSSKESSRHHKSHHKDHRDRHRNRDSEKQREREKEKERERKKQSEKDRETLAKVQGQSLSLGKLGAIPKKKATDSDKKTTGSSPAAAAAADAGAATASKKPLLPTPGERRPPTVKSFGAKFRSTGLEDAVSTAAPPKRKPAEVVRPPPPPPKRQLLPEPSAVTPPDKRSRFEQRPPVERPGGIKVIPPKPLHLQEASGFMDALNASTDVKRKTTKRARRLSSREESKEEKKGEPSPSATQTPPAPAAGATSPVAAKPLLKFYQDTQEDKEEEEDVKKESSEDKKSEDDSEKADDDKAAKSGTGSQDPKDPDEEERAPTPPTIPLERPSESEEAGSPRPRAPGELRGVLIYHRSASRRKHSVRWRSDNKLVDVRYFDLDENERVNVNRAKFMEMQAMEKMREREFLRRARSSRDDGMAEQMAWQMLIVVDKQPPRVTPGSHSKERAIQEERERTSLPAFFNPALLPDTPTEPELEQFERTPCKPIPLEDDQDGATVKDYSADGWPEPWPEPCAGMPLAGHGHALGHGPGPGLPPPPPMAPPGLLPPPPNSWGPSGPMQPGMGGMDGMVPPDMMAGPMGMHGPGPGFGGPQRPLGPPGGWGPIGPPMGPGGMMSNPAGMMGGPGGMGMMGPGPRPPYGGGGFRGRGGAGGGGGGGGGWRGGPEERRPRHEIPCKHHLSGYCRKGASCHFLHLTRNGGDPARVRGRADEYV